MIYEASKKGVALLAAITPNTLIPKLGEKVTSEKVEFYIWAEIYLTLRLIFSVVAVCFLPKLLAVGIVIGVIQAGSLIYLLKIVFPEEKRGLRDPARSLFFALGHYLEIGFSMAYIYWSWGEFSRDIIGRIDSVYYSFVTMTTLGYGDIYPKSDLTKILATGQTLVGMFMFAIVIGLFLSRSSQEH
ncbi:hypothetical protein GCM10011348_17070 [Marinobacterium nitratireducens]|uniref:Potassium channel domain-containing protein n=1 Tax=Marinobacterium nitratireducens TaxID=518897 RepID=A0A918DSD6_9GAMM|nr:potassium channel family protein [Marinobacterium nitratireducens]GGO80430.1 hypothetical protein GCM10011348_17070 [Marinobacterium nitratireducens]